MRTLPAVLLLSTVHLLASTAVAQNPEASLRLDGWSYIRFDNQLLLNLPPGTRVPLELTSVGPGAQAAIRIPDGFELPSIPYSAGDGGVKYHVVGDATGTVRRTAQGLVVSLAGTIRAAAPEDVAKGANYAVAFASEAPGSGAPADQVRLVTTTTNIPNADVAPGVPVEAVISGTIDGLPF